MKFTCESCDAKYRIPDEKISGRVLRMKCRRCGYPIVIKPGTVAPATPTAAVAPRHEEPRSEQWHVAINEVPVGPMSRKELQSHVAASRVGGDSLAWCEGMGDWRPMREIASLSSLLRGASSSQGSASRRRPAPPPRSMRAGPKAIVNPPTSPPERMVKPAAVEPPKEEAPARPAESVPRDDFEEAAATVVNDRIPAPAPVPVPVSAASDAEAPTELSQPAFTPTPEPEAPTPAAAAPVALESESPADQSTDESVDSQPEADISEDSADDLSLEIGSPVVVAPDQAQLAAPAAGRASSGRSSSASLVDIQAQLNNQAGGMPAWAKYIALVLGACLVMIVGVVTFVLMTREEPVAVVVAEEEAPSPAKVPPRHPQLQFEEPEPEEEEAPEVDEQASVGTRNRRGPSARSRDGGRAGRRAEARNTAAAADLTDEQREMMRRMGGGLAGAGAGSNIAVRRSETDSANSTRGTGLTQDQLRTVISNGQRGLRQCYERSIRGQLGASSVRINVRITVSPSGRVQSANAAGQGAAAGLTSCVESNVRRWVFPRASAASQTRFPLVFAPGS